MEFSKLGNFCKGICKFYKAHKNEQSKGYYSEGYRRCMECEMFLKWTGTKCPCCGRILRMRPHNNQCKSKLLRAYPKIR